MKILAGYVEKCYGALGVGVVALKGQLGNLLSETMEKQDLSRAVVMGN